MNMSQFNLNLGLMIILSCFSSIVSAQQFDQNYLKWKAQQQAIDQKLEKSDPNYYLSKPMTGRSNSASRSVSKASTDQVNINVANAQELQGLDGVGEKKAMAIIDYRQQHGRFKSVDELKEVKGIGPKLLEKNRSKLKI